MNDNDWLDWRRQGLGASDIPALLGLSTFQSPWSLWASKVGLLPDSETTERQRMGHIFEAAIAQLFHERTSLHVAGEQTWCTAKAHPWARATVDGFVIESQELNHLDDALGVLEIKTDGSFGWPDGPPPRVEAQVRWQMMVCDLPRAWVAVLHAGWRFDIHEIERDAHEEAFILERAARFWHDHVLTGQPPPVDGSTATSEAIGAVWPQHHEGQAVELPGEIASLLLERVELKAVAKQTKTAIDEIENRLRAAIGDAEIATVDGTPVLTLRAQERRGLDAKALERDHPDLAAKYQTTSTYRVLRNAPKAKKKAEAA